MEKLASTATTSYVSWKEVFISNDRGRREVHYFLKRRDGSSDLAVVGKEKSSRHMTYHYAIRHEALVLMGPSFSLLKLKSRREVIDWLNSICSDSSTEDVSAAAPIDSRDGCGYGMDIETLKDNQLRKLGSFTTDFSWLGSSWTCRKRRQHFQSFRRNGFKISVYDFVYVLAEEDKRLVAYLEDMYEDSRGNKMVVVRWFHKIDEVGIALPRPFCDREIFFSLCLQDLSVECIDGLTTVLSPQHYEKFQKEAGHTPLEPFVCDSQFDNDDVKPFDITQIKGYWRQEILRYMYTLSDLKSNGISEQSDDGPKQEENLLCSTGVRPKKRLRRVKIDVQDSVDLAAVESENQKSRIGENSLKQSVSSQLTSIKETNEISLQSLPVGSQVEVLSQDSGIRGCWFRASVIKKHKNKVKVRYHDIQDAADEDNKLEEWIPASRIAAEDNLGIHMHGRTMVRPAPQSNQCEISWVVGAGSLVDVWWHDGWWEGIVVQKESEAKYQVYFPGEKLVSSFDFGNLRRSQEWMGNEWMHLRERVDLVSSILSSLKTAQSPCESYDGKATVASSPGDGIQSNQENNCSDAEIDKSKSVVVPDLLKDGLLYQLRWKSSRKRRRGSPTRKLQYSETYGRKSPKESQSHASDKFMVPASLKVEHDDYKYRGDPSILGSSVVPSLTNLVMCR
ncbi:hypothetical protein L6164_001757 [Bauhinia variegata]|uniref:Uncharacterized protein n=1 Tax=Bauhinia variegata TaxID=167791 RepID=A0ACB9QBY3_BAUVA|nr:hypothetical protein L6164_001757 [Bauhinia variegata]